MFIVKFGTLFVECATYHDALLTLGEWQRLGMEGEIEHK